MTCVIAHSHSRVFKSCINRDPPFSYGGDSKTFRCLEELCWNQTPKPPRISRTSTSKSQEHSKRNHSSHSSRSQSSLESSSKASINTKRLQISESLQIQASKIQNNFHYKFSKTRNIRRTFKASRNFKDLYPLIFIIFKF